MKAIGDVETKRKFTAVANGAITSGDPCVIESAGTIAAIFYNSVTEALGTQVQVKNDDAEGLSASYDSSQNKVVLFYQDTSGVYGVVATIDPSDNSVSFGTEASYSESTSYRYSGHNAVYDSVNGKHVYVYSVGSTLKAVVATVSGTSLSFGTPVTAYSGIVSWKNTTYDSTSGKVIVAYSDESNSGRGTAQVGTVSGTSISFGSRVTFQSGPSQRIGCQYDPTNDKTLITYKDDSNNYGRAVVGTVSGTSISFGAEATYFSNTINQYVASYFDSEHDQVILFYSNNNYYPSVVAGTISGTSVTFGTPVVIASHGSNRPSADYDAVAKKGVVFWLHEADTDCEYSLITNNGSTLSAGTPVSAIAHTSQHTAVAYDSNAQRVLLAAEESGVPDLDARVLAVPYVDGNLAAENFIGFADAGYANGADASVLLSGSITREQSGLTAGQKYYVQNDGSLGTTADDPSVVAGTAISATELIVKG